MRDKEALKAEMQGQAQGQVQGQVQEQLRELEKAIEQLQATVGYLEDRLSSALRETETKESEGEPRMSLVPLAGSIRAQTYRVLEQGVRLAGILNRLEL